MNDEEKNTKQLLDSIDRMADVLAKVIKTASSAYDRLAHVEVRDGRGEAWRMLSEAVSKCHNLTRLGWQKLTEKHEVFRTPKEVIDFVTANPPMGEVKDPSTAKPKADEESVMSRPEAASILCRLATSRKIDADGVTALQMGARLLLKRHFEVKRWQARKRAKLLEGGANV